MLFLRVLPKYAAVGYFFLWVVFYPGLVPIAPVVSLVIHGFIVFVPLLGREFLTSIRVVVFLIGGILIAPFWLGLFGVAPLSGSL